MSKHNKQICSLSKVCFLSQLQCYEFSFLVPNFEIENICENKAAFDQIIEQFRKRLETVRDFPHLTDMKNINLN